MDTVLIFYSEWNLRWWCLFSPSWWKPIFFSSPLLFYLFLSHTVHPYCSLPYQNFLSPSYLSHPQIHCCSFTFLKQEVLLVIPTEHDITRCNKARHKSSNQCWIKQTNRRKGVPRASKIGRDTPNPTVRNTTKSSSYTTTVCMQIIWWGSTWFTLLLQPHSLWAPRSSG